MFNNNVPLHLLSSQKPVSVPQRRYLMTHAINKPYSTGRYRQVFNQASHRHVPTGPSIQPEGNHRPNKNDTDLEDIVIEDEQRDVDKSQRESRTLGTSPGAAQDSLQEDLTGHVITAQESCQDDASEYEHDPDEEDPDVHGDDDSSCVPISTNANGVADTKPKKHKLARHLAKRLNHLTSSGEAHMVNITDKKATARSAKARAFLYFGNEEAFASLMTANNEKGDALAVARIAGIQAAKKAADLIPLAHPGLGLTGVQLEIVPIKKKPQQQCRNLGVNSTTQFGGVKITAIVDCFGKTGVEMEALTSVTVATLTVYDMMKGIDKNMVITAARVLAKSGGKSGDWEYDTTTRQIKFLPPSLRMTNKNNNNADISREKINLQMQAIEIGKAKLRHEAERIQHQKDVLQLEHEKSKWREERLRYEKEKLQTMAEEVEIEKRKVALSTVNIREEIERGSEEKIQRMLSESGYTEQQKHEVYEREGMHIAAEGGREREPERGQQNQNQNQTQRQNQEQEQHSHRDPNPEPRRDELPRQEDREFLPFKGRRQLRDECSGSWVKRLDSTDFEQARVNRYQQWTRGHGVD